MESWINTRLKQLRREGRYLPDKPQSAFSRSIEHLLGQVVPVAALDADDDTCVCCQEAFSTGVEAAIRLPCGHVIGQECAWSLFSSQSTGYNDVNEDFNNKCPLCRVPAAEIDDSPQLNDENRERWMEMAHSIRWDVCHWMGLSDEEAIADIKKKGGFAEVLSNIDELFLMRPHVVRHFEWNECTEFNRELVETWVFCTLTSRKSRYMERTASDVYIAVSEASVQQLPFWDRWFDLAAKVAEESDWPEDPAHGLERLTLQRHIDYEMMPSVMWARLVNAVEQVPGVDERLVARMKLDALDMVTWAVRMGEWKNDFPELREQEESEKMTVVESDTLF